MARRRHDQNRNQGCSQSHGPEGKRRAACVLGVACIVIGALLLIMQGLDYYGWVFILPQVVMAIRGCGVVSLITIVCLAIWAVWMVKRGGLNRLSSHGSGLYRRSVKDKRICGVCGGLARYFGFNSAAIRLFAVILLVALPPTTVLAYFAIAVAIPMDNA